MVSRRKIKNPNVMAGIKDDSIEEDYIVTQQSKDVEEEWLQM